METTKKPNSMRHLDDAIRRVCGESSQDFIRMRTIMANSIVASMLPDGVIKGGCALKMRFGDKTTRFTTDLDTATSTELKSYIEQLSQNLKIGWEGFSGRIVERQPATPAGIPVEYLMRPYDVKLSFMGKPWCTVPLEVGHNEIGDADGVDWVNFTDAANFFEKIGLPSPGRVPLMPIEYQIAQKLHAVTTLGDRARDLVDLQLIANNSNIDFQKTKNVCVRLFEYRKRQTWPPVVIKQEGWDTLYVNQVIGLNVLQNIDAAIEWTNSFIQKIDSTNTKRE